MLKLHIDMDFVLKESVEFGRSGLNMCFCGAVESIAP